ncbi:MAG: hypothetical protein R3F60_24880 [bacterium]
MPTPGGGARARAGRGLPGAAPAGTGGGRGGPGPLLARLAEAQGAHRIADAAWSLAEDWLFALGRDADARHLQTERLGAAQRRSRGLFVRLPSREPQPDPEG